MTSAPPPRLELRSIDKAFPGCHANKAIDLTLAAGEIHALLGENGAGKSTLMKIVYGVLRADAGAILWEGRPVAITGPAAARRLGIGMVFQHFSLFESLSVAENVALGLDRRTPLAAVAARVEAVSARYGLPLDPGRVVADLSVGERQRVEIVRCLLQNPRLLIMDEPTSVLTPQEAETLFATLRRLRDEGCSILYISHKLEEVRRLCARATVLRGGAVVAAGIDPAARTARELAQLMVGAALGAVDRAPPACLGEARLVIDGLDLAAPAAFGTDLKAVSLQVHGGEIVGIAGVAGNGQNELMRALSGELPCPRPQAIRFEGQPIGHLDPRRRRDLGMGMVPEERLGRGAVPELSLSENALLAAHRRGGLVRHGLIRFGRADAFADRVIDLFRVVTHGRRAEARSLSGGNLQKFIVGREILLNPRLLICAQPTWGVDAGAAAAIHRALLALRDQGAAVLVISQDLDELFTIADRIAVLYHGRLSPAVAAHTASAEDIGLRMGGLFATGPDALASQWEEDAHGAA